MPVMVYSRVPLLGTACPLSNIPRVKSGEVLTSSTVPLPATSQVTLRLVLLTATWERFSPVSKMLGALSVIQLVR